MPFSAQDRLVADDPRAQARLGDAIEREFEFLRKSGQSGTSSLVRAETIRGVTHESAADRLCLGEVGVGLLLGIALSVMTKLLFTTQLDTALWGVHRRSSRVKRT